MKKVISVLLLACMLLTLTACGSQPAAPATDPTAEPAAEATEAPAAETAEAEYKLGMGVSVSLDSSDTNKAQVDATVATVVTDSEGKIVLCRIDCAQNKMDVTGGQVDTAATYTTKRDLKYDYNMVKYSNATLEWFEQVENLEKWVVGKTADEIKNIETRVNEEGYNVAVDEELFASCSISLEAFQEAIVKACNDEKGSTFTAVPGSFTLGVSAISNSTESVSAADSEDGNAMVKMYTEFGAAAVGSDGKILAALTDAIQPKITVSAEGEIVSKDYTATKRELGDDYNMVKYGNAIAEWDAQAKAFADYTVGMTADEVSAMETTEHNGHDVTVDETLFASCTMDITGMRATIATAANNAR